jgi:hypothetical protein
MEDEKCQDYSATTSQKNVKLVKSSVESNNSIKDLNEDRKLPLTLEEWSNIKLNLQKNPNNPEMESPDKSVTGSLFSSSKFPNIICKIHGKDSITVDTSRFIIICTQCIEEGQKGYLENVEDIDEYEDDAETMCKEHINIPGVFYCDDCKCFVCKLCFANNHRTHNSNILSLIGEGFKQTLRALIEKYCLAKPKVEEAYSGILSIHQNIKKVRDNSLKRAKDMITNVINVNKNASNDMNIKLKSKFADIDNETEEAYNRLIMISKKLNKFITDLEEITWQAKIIKDPMALCEYKKSKVTIFKDIKQIVSDCTQLLDYKIEFLKKQVNEKSEMFKKQLAFFNKQTAIYEKSILTSIKSGVSNSTYVLRRFTKFSSRGLKYYKTSSVLVKVNTAVFLSGLGLCGAYISSEKRKKADYTSENNFNLNLTVSEFCEDRTVVEKVNEKHKMMSIINRYDPLFLVYLRKGLYLKPQTTYMITIINNDSNSYIDIWTGECSKKYLENMCQTLVCNCTGVEFVLKPAKDVESDLNEFNSGIVSSLIYSFTKSR